MQPVFIFLGKVFKKIAGFFEGLGTSQSFHENQVKYSSSRHDMAKHPDEGYYAKQYLYWLDQDLKGSTKANALDLGCGQGRLSIPLAAYCSHITGVDFTPEAIEAAKKYALDAKCENIEFVLSDLGEYIKGLPDASFDFIVFTEVSFILPNYMEVLKNIYRVLKPGGKVFVAFRSQYFNLLHSVQRQKWDSAHMAIDKREGYLWGGSTWFGWQTTTDVKRIFSGLGFKDINCVGIGVVSGIEGDPLSSIARPSQLDAWGTKRMMDIEIQLAHLYTEQGRYILARANK